MCRECLQTPCDPRCPNAPDSPVLAYCDNCGVELCEGDTAFSCSGVVLCEDCVKDFTGVIPDAGF